MPEISVIIPVYNKEQYVRKALESVLDQSFVNIEVIVVNDGSTDRSLEIIQEIAETDNRVHIIDIPNAGVSNARNVGLLQSSGNWIQFLDADDWLEPDYLAEAVRILIKNKADILFSGFRMVDVHGKVIREITSPMSGITNELELCDSFIHNQYKSGYFGFISNKLFNRVLLNKSGARFPVGVTLAEDLDFYSKLYPFVTTAYFWNKYSFGYLQTEDNYLNIREIDYYSQLKIHMDIKKWFERVGTYFKYRKILDEKITQYAYYIFFNDNEKRVDLSNAFDFLHSESDIMESIDPSYMKGFSRKILQYLCINNLIGIKALFFVRNCVRSFFRMVRING